jgi:hypothetical protein
MVSASYISDYISKRLSKLKKLIDRICKCDDILFCPNSASPRSAKEVTEWSVQNNIPFVPKCLNFLRVCKARPFKNFWTELDNKHLRGKAEN